VKVALTKATPTEVTPQDLQQQLRDNMGLHCKYTEIPELIKLKADVLSQWTDTGSGQAYGVFIKNKDGVQKDAVPVTHLNIKGMDLLARFGFSNEGVKGEWEPSDSAQGYTNELFTIQSPANFWYLARNFPQDFAGIHKEKSDTRRVGTVDAVKNFFAEIGKELAALTVNGVDLPSLQPILYKALGVSESSLDRDYDEGTEQNPKTRVIFLVENYNPQTKEADAIGALAIDWALHISNYKEKKEEVTHTATLKLWSRAVLYTELNFMYRDYYRVVNHFKSRLFAGNIPPRPEKLTVFDYQPPPCYDSFIHGLPLMCTSSDYIDTVILYNGDIQLLYAMDNTESPAESTFQKSITEGFTFSAQQTLSTELSFEAGCDIAKTGFKMSISVSFTEQWNKTVTETVSFKVPAGERAFAYQAYINTAILRYTAADHSYRYVESAKFLTSSLKTLKDPVIIG
jgi:hypothetical protein